MSETAEFADVVLPAASFAEKSGTFTNTERRVQLIRPAIEPVGQAKPDWEITSEIAARMGYDGFDFNSTAEIAREVAQVTPIYGGIHHDRLQEKGLQWPCADRDHPGTKFLHEGEFARGKGRFHKVDYREAAETPDEEYPYILTTGRMLYHFHTGTMSRRSKGLDRFRPDAYVEINPTLARELEVRDGDWVTVKSRRGSITTRAWVTDRTEPDVVFVPFHFAEAAANELTNKALDPQAKIPEYKVCAVDVEKVTAEDARR